MKKIILFVLAAAMAVSLCACAKNPRCTLDAAKEKMSAAEKVVAYVYEDEKSYEVAPEILEELLTGEWTEDGRTSGAKKIISVTIGDQYELCFFEDGSAMIYSGLAGILQRDRAYYQATPDVSLEDVCKAVREVGKEIAEEEDNKMPSAE